MYHLYQQVMCDLSILRNFRSDRTGHRITGLFVDGILHDLSSDGGNLDALSDEDKHRFYHSAQEYENLVTGVSEKLSPYEAAENALSSLFFLLVPPDMMERRVLTLELCLRGKNDGKYHVFLLDHEKNVILETSRKLLGIKAHKWN